MMIMNLDYYYLFVFCNTLQQASIVSTIRRSFFFFFLAGTVRKTEKHTTTHTHICTLALTTHEKAFRVSFYYLFCLCFGILPLLLLLPLLDSAGHFVCFVSISVCHVVIIICGLHRIPGS